MAANNNAHMIRKNRSVGETNIELVMNGANTPDRYKDSQCGIMFVGLYIELTALEYIVSLLDCSGWTVTHVETDIESSCFAEALLRAP